MKHIKYSGVVIFGLLMILAMLSAYAPSTQAGENPGHEKVRLTMLSNPMGGGLYEWWATYERIFEKNHPWLRPAVQESPGFAYNLKIVSEDKRKWKEVMFAMSQPVRVAAEHAIQPFFKVPIPEKPWKLVFPTTGCASMTFVWVTLDPKIKTMMNFEGKRLGLGQRGQINFGVWPTLAVEVLGIKPKLEYIGSLEAVNALLDGRVDAATVSAYLPIAQQAGEVLKPSIMSTLQTVVASGKKFYYVSYGPDWIERFRQQKGYDMAQVWKIESGTLPNQPHEIIGAQAEPSAWVVHESFPDEIVYEFTKFMLRYGKELQKYSEIGVFFTIPVGALFKKGFKEENTHPGAIRAYKEAGVWK